MRKLTRQLHQGQPLSEGQAIVGASIKHESAANQVSGQALFIDDYKTPQGCLHGAIVTSSIVKGRIENLNLDAVRQAPGVVAVYQFSDIPGHTDIGAIVPGDPLLSDGAIKYHNQPIALVLAQSHRQAWQAAQLAKIDYQEATEVYTDFEQARHQPHLLDAHTMGVELSASAFEQAEVVIEGEQAVGGQEHFYLETQVSLAELTEENGIFLRTSSQHPTEVQTLVAEVLGLPFHKVTVDMRRMGGAFGGKETQAAQWACLASLGAFLSRHPVKLRLPRGVDMSVTGKRHPFYNRYKLAATQQGVIQSCDIEVNGLCGHSADLSAAIVDRAMFHCDNAYHLGQAHVVGNRLKTDTVSHTAFRGFGGPQGMILIEQAIEQLAIACNMDALDVRLNNLYRAGKATTHYGMPIEQCDEQRDIIERLEQSSDYRARRQQINQYNQRSSVLKRGLALTPVKFGISFTATHLNQAGALVHVYTDGSVQVSHGGTEMGQGLHTKVGQIVAQTLGTTLDAVLVTSTRTDKVPNSSPTAASSGADLNGMAAHHAASTIKARLIEFAAQAYNCPAESIRIEQGQVQLKEQSISWAALVQQAYMARVSLSENGFYKTPKIHYDPKTATGRPFFYFALGAACSEVLIDTLTGEMQVERVDILHDVGHSLNPAIDIGQIEGAFVQGMGWLTNEELVWDKSGRLLSNSPMNYKIPSIGDYPKQMNIDLYGKSNPEHSIYRSKAVGEPPFMLAMSVWCAIFDAVASISHHQVAPKLSAPATGEQILNACQGQFASLAAQPEATAQAPL
jgi:xanthine dehydrogenase large subunit